MSLLAGRTVFPRLFLGLLLVLVGGSRLLAQTNGTSLPLDRPADGWEAEADRLTRLVQRTWWDAKRQHYVSPGPVDGTVATEDEQGVPFHGHTLWPWTEALRMLVAAEEEKPGEYADDIAEVYAGMEKYFDPQRGAYNAWVMFPGNVDSYSDDNAWIMMGLCDAAEATGNRAYAERASEIMERYVSTEWRDDDGPLGMRWGYKKDGPRHQNMRAAISASTSAVAAMRLADLGFNPEKNMARAEQYLAWIEEHCIDDEGLVMDGLQHDGEGGWRMEETRWTYNTGLVITANAMLYERTGRDDILARVRRSADAAIDRTGRMYDGIVTDPDLNYFYDSAFFASHLIEALVKASEVLEDPKYRDEAERNAAYLYTYVRDPADGLYFRNMRLWRIDQAHFDRFREVFARAYDTDRLSFRPEGAERSRSREHRALPVEERPLVKTLLANAAVARAYWSLAEEADTTRPSDLPRFVP